MDSDRGKVSHFFRTLSCTLGLLAVVAGALFLILQWPDTFMSEFSVYGKPVTVRTLYLVLGSAAGGLLYFMVCKWSFVASWRLYQSRKAAKIASRGPEPQFISEPSGDVQSQSPNESDAKE